VTVPTAAATDATAAARRPILSVVGIEKRFGQRKALDSVDFEIQAGERVCIVGRNGSGKTTLLRCLNLLVEPTAGRLYFRDELLGEWNEGRGAIHGNINEYRKHFGMVFQDFGLFPHLTALDNVTLGPRHSLHEAPGTAESRGRELLAKVGLDQYLKARPTSMSGGQKQRLAIARALAMKPDLVLFDEPTSALDPTMVDEVLETIKALALSGTTMVVVTHEVGFAREVADRIVVFDAGKIIEQGPPDRLFGAPEHESTRQILRPRR
jgi:ABC-type polar amino acid transport system ATPase subunit